MHLTRKAHVKFEVNEMTITWFCDVNDDMGLHSVSDFNIV